MWSAPCTIPDSSCWELQLSVCGLTISPCSASCSPSRWHSSLWFLALHYPQVYKLSTITINSLYKDLRSMCRVIIILLECMLSCVRCRRSGDSQGSVYAQAMDNTDCHYDYILMQQNKKVCTYVILNKHCIL